MLATENCPENAAIWQNAPGTDLREAPQRGRRVEYGQPSCSGGGDPSPCGSAPSPLCSHSLPRRLRSPLPARGRAAATRRRSSSTHEHTRRSSASTRSTRSCSRGERGSARSRPPPPLYVGSARRSERSSAPPRRPSRPARRRLAVELRALYERGNVNSVAVVLGAKSLSAGLSQLDDLSRVADQSRQLVAVTSAAHRRLLRSQRRLAAEERRLERSLAAARQAEGRLAAAAASRAAYVASLRAQLRAQQVRTVEAQAQTVQQRSQQLQTTASPSAGKRQLTVSATCYDLSGRTATGMPVGHGVVAVDPAVIPLGTRMYVPGYGNGVAADVGGGIKGDIIDLWMTPSECAAWGRRTVTITIY